MIDPILPMPGNLVTFTADGDDDRADRLAHAWDPSSAEYVPVPWGKTAIVLGVDPSDGAWNWVEVLTEGRVLLVLSEDLISEEAL